MTGAGVGDPVVSVVVPARDAAATLGRQLGALAAQDLDRPFEVVVVDNGSKDETVEVARGFSDRLRLTVIDGPEAPNRSAARNAGAARAAAPVLAFCDADDEVGPAWLSSLVRATETHPVVTGSNLRTDDRPGSDEGPPARPSFRGVPTLASGNFAIRRELYDSVGGFRTDLLHRVDTDLSCRLLLTGVRVHHEPGAVIRYHRRVGLRAEMRQQYHWGIAGADLHKRYGADLAFSYSWRNSLKHWALLPLRGVRSVGRPASRRQVAVTLASLCGQLVGSFRYRTLYI